MEGYSYDRRGALPTHLKLAEKLTKAAAKLVSDRGKLATAMFQFESEFRGVELQFNTMRGDSPVELIEREIRRDMVKAKEAIAETAEAVQAIFDNCKKLNETAKATRQSS